MCQIVGHSFKYTLFTGLQEAICSFILIKFGGLNKSSVLNVHILTQNHIQPAWDIMVGALVEWEVLYNLIKWSLTQRRRKGYYLKTK